MWLTRRQKQKLSWRTCDLDDRQLISHIGIAVDDLEQATATYELLLGCKPILVTEVKDQKVKIAMFSPSATDSSTGGRIELLAGTAVHRVPLGIGTGEHPVLVVDVVTDSQHRAGGRKYPEISWLRSLK